MNQKELEDLMEKAKAATQGPWSASIGSDEDGEVSIVGPVDVGDSIQTILNNAVCYLKPDNIQSNCNNIYIAAANPQVVLDLCERVIRLSEALELANDYPCRYCSLPDSIREALDRFGVKL